MSIEMDADETDLGIQAGELQRSTVRFPYGDLQDGIDVVAAIKADFGSSCEATQLAGALKLSFRSSGFRTRVATASTFGLVQASKGVVHLTELGHRVADLPTRPGALVDSFLAVELFNLVYERFLGKSLPGDAGLEVEIRDLGVAPKQADRARRAMQRSAEVAGLFWAGRDRLVKPGNVAASAQLQATPEADAGDLQPAVNAAPNLSEDPVLVGLWKRLPASGDFPAKARTRWLSALEINLDLVYGPADESPEDR